MEGPSPWSHHTTALKQCKHHQPSRCSLLWACTTASMSASVTSSPLPLRLRAAVQWEQVLTACVPARQGSHTVVSACITVKQQSSPHYYKGTLNTVGVANDSLVPLQTTAEVHGRGEGSGTP